MEYKVVIPARYASSRFPGKILAPLEGRPMIQHVYDNALAAGASEVLIATDDQAIADVVEAFGGVAIMTDSDHQSGTDRVAEVAAIRCWPKDAIVVNLQGDAPCLPSASVASVAQLLADNASADMATLSTALEKPADYHDKNVVKLVTDRDGRALYFSRSPIPAAGHGSQSLPTEARRHLGIYAYKVEALRTLSATPACYLEEVERLEQLRALWLGMEIRVGTATEAHGPDVDTVEDLGKAAAYLARR